MMREVKPGYWKGEIWIRGKRRTITFKGSAAGAKLYEAERKVEASAKGISDSRTVPGFGSFCVDVYKPHAKMHLGRGTWDVRRYQLENLILFFGDLRFDRINEQHIEQYKQARIKEAAKETINSELNVFCAVRTYAKDHLKLSLPDLKIRRYKIRRKKAKVRFWTAEELQRIFDACMQTAPKLFPLLFFLGQTGARKGEAIHLPWTNVDLENRIAKIWSEPDEDDPDDDPFETKSGDREVPLSDPLLGVLRKLKEKRPLSQYVFSVTQGKTKGKAYAFFPKNTFDRVLDKAGLTGSPHMFRHTYASLFLANKPDLFLVCKLLGHSTYKVTERIYAHLVPGYLEEARNVIPANVPPDPKPRPSPRP
jgi:integrase